eukprot:69412-Amphidinium_carterae.1
MDRWIRLIDRWMMFELRCHHELLSMGDKVSLLMCMFALCMCVSFLSGPFPDRPLQPARPMQTRHVVRQNDPHKQSLDDTLVSSASIR